MYITIRLSQTNTMPRSHVLYVVSVSCMNDFITFLGDDDDSLTFHRKLIEATEVCCHEEGWGLLYVEVHGIPLYEFHFDSKEEANLANDVIVGKKHSWVFPKVDETVEVDTNKHLDK